MSLQPVAPNLKHRSTLAEHLVRSLKVESSAQWTNYLVDCALNEAIDNRLEELIAEAMSQADGVTAGDADHATVDWLATQRKVYE